MQSKVQLNWGLLGILTGILLVVMTVPPTAFNHITFNLLSHTLFELVAVLAALMIFAISWHTFDCSKPCNVLLLALGFLSVAIFDLMHTMSFRGMPELVTASSPSKAIYFWLAARTVATLTLLAIAFRPWRPLGFSNRKYLVLSIVVALDFAFIASILYLPEYLPQVWVDGQGLTPFKVLSEFTLIGLLAFTAYKLYTAGTTGGYDRSHLLMAVLVSILSEICFTSYTTVSDVYHLIGHSYKIISFWYIYSAVFISNIKEPYNLLEREIALHKESQDKVHHMAYHDILTNLPNRALVQQKFEDMVALAKKNNTNIAVVFIDLDNFKTINDTLGHSTGDALLVAVADRLKKLVRHSDILSRMGGDEFLLVLGDLENYDAALPVITKLLSDIQAPFVIDDHNLSCSLSIGVSFFPDDDTEFESLLRKADTAMYQAKAAGRNAYKFFTKTMLQDTINKLEIRTDLKRALQNNEFILHYQPQVDLKTNICIGVEALIRWYHPKKGLIPPNVFIPIAEESGLIVPIGSWVIQEATRQMAKWHRMGLTNLSIAINISPAQFYRGDLESIVSRAITESGLDPKHLELEITEGSLIQDSRTAEVLKTLSNFASVGLRVAVDDFGTGYSSLSYLRKFPIDRLKIDQSFVKPLESNPEELAIVMAIIQMGHSLGLDVIAEGIETKEVATLLETLKCDMGQGYFWSKPLSEYDCFLYLKGK